MLDTRGAENVCLVAVAAVECEQTVGLVVESDGVLDGEIERLYLAVREEIALLGFEVGEEGDVVVGEDHSAGVVCGATDGFV